MESSVERSGIVKDQKTGELFIPASRRPDGTWRKARKVKDGYIPQEEVPVYENKGVQWMKSRESDLPPGYHPEEEKPSNTAGLSKAAKKNLRRKEKKKQAAAAAAAGAQGVEIVTDSMATASISTSKDKTKASIGGQSKGSKTKPNESGSSATTAKPSTAEPSKKLKNLKKKLRQIEDLEGKMKSGELKNPEKEQLEKVAKKQEIIEEIDELERNL